MDKDTVLVSHKQKKRPYVIAFTVAFLLVAYLFYASQRIYKRLNSAHNSYDEFVVSEYEITPLDMASEPAPDKPNTSDKPSPPPPKNGDMQADKPSNSNNTNNNTNNANTNTTTGTGTTDNSNNTSNNQNQNAEQDLDEKVSFKGGPEALRDFLNKYMVYPANAKSRKTEGTIMVIFTVELDGTIRDISTDGKGDSELSKEAIRVIKLSSGNWIPGKIRKNSVRSICRMPIEFQLSINDF